MMTDVARIRPVTHLKAPSCPGSTSAIAMALRLGATTGTSRPSRFCPLPCTDPWCPLREATERRLTGGGLRQDDRYRTPVGVGAPER